MYEYRARCTRVIDGDTAEFDVDLGFNIRYTIRGRFLNVNAPEIFRGTDEEKEKGNSVKLYVENLILNKDVIVKTHKNKMSFNRWIVEILHLDGKSINEEVKNFIDDEGWDDISSWMR